ncbi:indolepyruvate ferredoxin oxidoreductase subunit alpha [Advenella mimigardefordensis]|uniref:Putative indolepyruvate ferredoxin oxidoreductase subunit IorA n=1 Tax=Advenella mimigardefordensis (strain DSM 17166 / LMG 22922 / DPN7) TaxID=1247726 RepID=W0PHS5_ADVMD|nr:indolepyruvate ferredoxin oxidoreductase subunit alpha [Advenella mimigardefordensis]AHG65342.1 putative indolepyruvate ferredoxin oxidoreductase subunit IorA [Advenella mimigardefordensis DPN7]
MAERSFKKEVQTLKIGAGEEFRGEGILAITKALLQSGVGYVAGYQGAPISHLMDVLADADDILKDLGIHFESSASEATAAATLSASVMYPIRGAVTWKSTVGTNVASDALANLASGGVTGGALVIVGEDYGEGSSIMQERTHAFAMKSQMWMLDPRPNLACMVDMVETGFRLSEASSTPVFYQVRIRGCHVHGRFIAKDNVAPPFTLAQALETPRRDAGRIVLPPAAYEHEQEKVRDRWPAAVKFLKDNRVNEFFAGNREDIGIIVQGGLYNNTIRALGLLGKADHFGKSELPIYVLNAVYPLISDEVEDFCRNKKAVLLIEEGQPDYIEQNIHSILRKAGINTPLSGKDVLPMAGEYTVQTIRDGLRDFLDNLPSQLVSTAKAEPVAKPTVEQPIVFTSVRRQQLADIIPPRPAGLCTGCPERPVFSALTLAQEKLGEHHISCDIGCHLFSILPPFNLGATTMGYGLGASSASAFNVKAGKRSISIMGDGGFWHNGLTSGVGNAVYNKHDGVIIIVDNYYSSATGGQDILSSRADNDNRSTNHPIEQAVRGVGVKWVRVIDRTYDVSKMRALIEDALTCADSGPKVIIAQSECMLNLQRREKPAFKKDVTQGVRRVRQQFGVDQDICSGDHACIRLSGCPSLTLKDNDNPLKDDPVAHVESSCVGCGHCGEIAHEAVLCPSFYRADIIHNPGRKDHFLNRIRNTLIGKLQRRHRERIERVTI